MKWLVYILMVVAGLILGILVTISHYRGASVTTEEKSDTIRLIDTVHDPIPVPVTRAIERIDTVRLPVADTLIIATTDSIYVEVPIETAEYTDSATYRAWVSGYRARLDSIDVYAPTTIVTKEVTKRVRDTGQRWHIGPTVGVGYTRAGVQPYIGVGISYSIFCF